MTDLSVRNFSCSLKVFFSIFFAHSCLSKRELWNTVSTRKDLTDHTETGSMLIVFGSNKSFFWRDEDSTSFSKSCCHICLISILLYYFCLLFKHKFYFLFHSMKKCLGKNLTLYLCFNI